MRALEIIDQTRQYLNFLEKQFISIQKAWDIIQIKCDDFLDNRIIKIIKDDFEDFDISRFDEVEFNEMRDYYFSIDSHNFNNSNNKFINYAQASNNHILKNRHAIENWLILNSKAYALIQKKAYCVESIIEWYSKELNDGMPLRKYYEEIIYLKYKLLLEEDGFHQFITHIIDKLEDNMKC